MTTVEPRVPHVELPQEAKHAIVNWQQKHAGRAGGGPWWPRAIRSLKTEVKLRLAFDEEFERLWIRRERAKVRDPRYFVSAYGSLEGPGGTERLPFDLWPFQEHALDLMTSQRHVLFLKARQLGFTSLALHLALHAIAFDPETPGARVLALSKKEDDASKLIVRARRIIDCLPPFLRPAETAHSERSKTEIRLENRGSLVSLSGSPESARGEPAVNAVLMDEFAFIPNRNAAQTLTAALPSIGDTGRLWLISTGNGRVGDGAAFFDLWDRTRSGKTGFTSLFVPSSQHPERDEAWHERERDFYPSEEDFRAEYPETEEQAFQRKGGELAVPASGVNAAEVLGRKLTEHMRRGELKPAGTMPWLGIDWGDHATAIYVIWPLPQGSVYIPPCEVMTHRMEPGETMLAALDKAKQLGLPIRTAWYDAAGASSMKTGAAVLRTQIPDFRTVAVNFGGKAAGSEGGKSYKFEGIRYLRFLFRRTAEGHQHRVIGIDPENVRLLEQLRDWRWKEDKPDEIDKGDDDGPDALTAGITPLATKWRAMTTREREE